MRPFPSTRTSPTCSESRSPEIRRSAKRWPLEGAEVSIVGQRERVTQNRVIALFRDELGYRYLGDWTDRPGNSNVEEGLLSAWLTQRGYTAPQINVALHNLPVRAGPIRRSAA